MQFCLMTLPYIIMRLQGKECDRKLEQNASQLTWFPESYIELKKTNFTQLCWGMLKRVDIHIGGT